MAKHPDVPLLRSKDVLDVSWNSARAVNIPVMADVNSGGADVRNDIDPTNRLNAVSLAGMDIGDHSETTVRDTATPRAEARWERWERWERWFYNLTARTIV
jgi:2-methylisocitrate lyase-like PEP mutase family enzyme